MPQPAPPLVPRPAPRRLRPRPKGPWRPLEFVRPLVQVERPVPPARPTPLPRTMLQATPLVMPGPHQLMAWLHQPWQLVEPVELLAVIQVKPDK